MAHLLEFVLQPAVVLAKAAGLPRLFHELSLVDLLDFAAQFLLFLLLYGQLEVVALQLNALQLQRADRLVCFCDLLHESLFFRSVFLQLFFMCCVQSSVELLFFQFEGQLVFL